LFITIPFSHPPHLPSPTPTRAPTGKKKKKKTFGGGCVKSENINFEFPFEVLRGGCED
jgi:hypothetical protein